MSNKITGIRGCSACGQDHDDMYFVQMDEKDAEGFTHVTVCPNSGEEVFLKQMNYSLFNVNSSNKLEIQAIDEVAPDGYDDDSAALEFVRDLEAGVPEAVAMARELVLHHTGC